ncbi:MAG: NACHT domain-containing protein, partial [Sphingobacterium siyangense]
MKSKNISQYYHRYDSYADLDVGKPVQKNPFGSATLLDPHEIFGFDQVFIVAEPGHGKTTLIAEIKSILDSDNIGYYSKTGTDYHGEQLVKIEGHKYFIFDALDETKDVVASFLTIQKFCNDTNIKLIISNRTHYLSMISHLLLEENYVFIQLWPFSEDQIMTFLKVNLNGLNYQEDDYLDIIRKSKSTSRNSILSIPRYLDEFCKYLTKSKISAQMFTQTTKSELIDNVIYYKLESEGQSETTLSNKNYLTKRVLEKLALVMEIHELNRISKDDFITFLDQTDSNISLIFLNLIDLDVLLNRVMKTTGVFLQFENSEFQEYLAAKELVRLGYRFQTIYDLMFDKELHLLLPNWIDVLTFAIELEPEFVKPIITFIRKKKYINIDEKLILILLNVAGENFSEEFKNEFFNTIFEYYISKGRIFYSVNEALSKFVTESNERILKPIYKIEDLKDAVLHIQSNQIL